MNRKNHTRTLVTASMLAALIFIVTFQVAIPVPSTSAYVNMGDSIIYATAMLIGAPWAAIAAALGSALADWAIGFPVYIPATLIIKGLMGFVCATLLKRNIKLPKYILSCIIGGAIMVAGYAAYELILMGGWGYVGATIIPNLIQWVGGVAAAIALYYPVKRIKEAIK